MLCPVTECPRQPLSLEVGAGRPFIAPSTAAAVRSAVAFTGLSAIGGFQPSPARKPLKGVRPNRPLRSCNQGRAEEFWSA